jgi:hypothetical protein
MIRVHPKTMMNHSARPLRPRPRRADNMNQLDVFSVCAREAVYRA